VVRLVLTSSTSTGVRLACGLLSAQGFYGKKGYKYGRYRKAMEFIRSHGYDAYLDAAASWTGAYGKLP
jgi:hypothetical protein